MLREGRWWARLWAWLVLIVVLAAIGATDVLHAMNYTLRHRPTEGVVAGAPVVAVLLAFSLLLTMLRQSRTRGDAPQPAAVPAPLDVPALPAAVTVAAADRAPGRPGPGPVTCPRRRYPRRHGSAGTSRLRRPARYQCSTTARCSTDRRSAGPRRRRPQDAVAADDTVPPHGPSAAGRHGTRRRHGDLERRWPAERRPLPTRSRWPRDSRCRHRSRCRRLPPAPCTLSRPLPLLVAVTDEAAGQTMSAGVAAPAAPPGAPMSGAVR